MATRNRTLGLKLRAIDKMSASIDRVQKRFPKLARSVRRASRAAKIFSDQTKQMRRSLTRMGNSMRNIGANITRFVTLPIIAAGVAGVVMFGNFEQGLRGIEKTTGLARIQVGKLGARFDQLSTIIPVSTKEMLTLAQSGGQLGIKGVKNIEKFTIVMAKLSRASDVAGEAGAKSIARILTVTGTGIKKVDRFAAALVDLGNNAAASESEILEVSNRVAGAISRFDVGAASVLGISTALRALGKRAESSGSVIGRAFNAIDLAIKKGGNAALLLSKLTGISVAKLKTEFSQNAAKVFQKLIGGFAKVQKGGGNLIKIMKFLGLEGVRINDILGTLAKRPEVLARNMQRATKAFKENIALNREFKLQTESLNSALILIKNTFTSLLRLIGAELAPAVIFIGDIFKKIFNFLRANPALRTLLIVFGGVLAVLGPLMIALGSLVVPFLILTKVAALFGIALIPLTLKALLIVGVIAAVVAISVLLFKNWDKIRKVMSENIFGKAIIFVGFMVQALGKLFIFLGKITTQISSFKDISKGFKELFSIGEVKIKTPKILKKKKEKEEGGRNVLDFSKAFEKAQIKSLRLAERVSLKGNVFGESLKAREKNEGIARVRSDKFSGKLAVAFENAPEGLRVRSESEGPVELDLGFVGGIQ